jgi:RNA polymerase sigma-70 factor (ECF subfamily)
MHQSTSLLRRVRGGDEKALTRAYDEYAPRIYRYAYRLTGHRATAQDVASETFRRLLTALSRGGGPTDNLSAWLYRVAHNLVVDGFRGQPDEVPVPLQKAPQIPVPSRAEGRVERAEAVAAARAALSRLTPLQQQAIALRFLEGLSIRETAQIMGKTEGAVKALQYRGMNSLRRILEDEHEET